MRCGLCGGDAAGLTQLVRTRSTHTYTKICVDFIINIIKLAIFIRDIIEYGEQDTQITPYPYTYTPPPPTKIYELLLYMNVCPPTQI